MAAQRLGLSILILCLAQPGDGQRSVGGGVSVTGSSGMGYDSPSVGGFVRGQYGPVRAIGEVDNSQKWWVRDGMSWRTFASLDSPAWHRLSALAIGGVSQHRNSQWVKTGGWYGGGLRYGPLYSWYSPADTSMNRVRRWATGVEVQRGRLWWQYEVQRSWFDAGAGWGVGARIGTVKGMATQ